MTIGASKGCIEIEIQETGSEFRLEVIERVVKGMNWYLSPFYVAKLEIKENIQILIK